MDYLHSLLTTDEIAAAMFLSPNTVKTHRRGIYQKLGVHSRTAAITAAARLGCTPAACPTCGTPI